MAYLLGFIVTLCLVYVSGYLYELKVGNKQALVARMIVSGMVYIFLSYLFGTYPQ